MKRIAGVSTVPLLRFRLSRSSSSSSSSLLLPMLLLFGSVVTGIETPEGKHDLLHSSKIQQQRRPKRAAVADPRKLWDNATIPYDIDPVLPDYSVTILRLSMREWEKATCLTFLPRSPTDVNFVHFTRTDCGCCTPVGNKRNGSQFFSISPNCSQMGNIMHELGHTIGFYHEQSRPDRDKYIHIHFENIDKHLQHNFRLYKDLDPLGEPYDFDSIMHYPLVYPAKGGKTIMSVVGGRPSMKSSLTKVGQRSVLSPGDIRQTNKLYKCPECGKTLVKNTGSLDYHGPWLRTKHAAKKYFARALCQWRIIGGSGDIVELTIERARIPNNKNCSSHITIRDGHYNSPVLVKKCGAAIKKPIKIRSTGARMFVEFKLAPGGRYWTPGFTAQYRTVSFKRLEGESGNFTSPNYPSFYPFFKLCHYLIRTPNETSFLRLNFHQVEIGEDDGCQEEYIDVRDGEFDRVRSIGRFCGNSSDRVFYSSSNVLLVVFKSFSTNQRGFSASYSTETAKHWKRQSNLVRKSQTASKSSKGTNGGKNLTDTREASSSSSERLKASKTDKVPAKPKETPTKDSKSIGG